MPINYQAVLYGALLALAAHPAWAAPQIVIDWSKGAIQETAASCGPIIMNNLADHQGYSLLVRGAASGVCVFEADDLKFHLPSNFGATNSSSPTLFHFTRFGADVFVTWMPGY